MSSITINSLTKLFPDLTIVEVQDIEIQNVCLCFPKCTKELHKEKQRTHDKGRHEVTACAWFRSIYEQLGRNITQTPG